MKLRRNLFFMGAILSMLVWNGPALAFPTLQLDISNGVYDATDDIETVIATSQTFTLYALLNSDDVSGTYYISAAVTPQVESEADLGSFLFAKETISVTDDMDYGTPPVELSTSKDLASHSIYPTYFKEFALNFDTGNTVGAYNSQDYPGGFENPSIQSDSLEFYYAAFDIDVSGLEPGFAIHFDLYNKVVDKNGNITVGDFAPFSHDAQSSPAPIPEPASMLLFGSGVLSAMGVVVRRKKRFADGVS